MVDTSYKYFELYSKLKNLKKDGVAQNLSFREFLKIVSKTFSASILPRFGFHKTLKNTWQMKDKIKCIKKLYIFYQNFEI